MTLTPVIWKYEKKNNSFSISLTASPRTDGVSRKRCCNEFGPWQKNVPAEKCNGRKSCKRISHAGKHLYGKIPWHRVRNWVKTLFSSDTPEILYYNPSNGLEKKNQKRQ